MKILFFSISMFVITFQSIGQQNYCDFEGSKSISFGPASGIIDSMIGNPDQNSVNSSANCAKYIRNNTLYDNFKLYPYVKLADVSSYESNNALAPKLTMKIYSSAPVGTFIELQLGAKSDDNYPSGIHSEYRAVTTVKNEWQNLIFHYLQSPTGGLVTPYDVDKIVILFHPNSSDIDTMYFDDLTGPLLVPAGVYGNQALATFQLYPNSPNPAQEITHINFQLNTPGVVNLNLFDLLGNPVMSISNEYMKAGAHSIPVETENIPSGVYFYILNKEGVSRTRKLIVSQ